MNRFASDIAVRAAATLDRTRAAQDKAQAVLDRFTTTITWIDGAVAVAGNVPGLHGVCTQIRGLLNRVSSVGDVAQDVPLFGAGALLFVGDATR